MRGRLRGLCCAGAAALLLAACYTTRTVEQRDWGAIPPEETIRVTTTDGAQRDLTGVTVYKDALVGVDPRAADAAADSVRIPLEQLELIEIRSLSLARTALAVVAVGGTIGVIAALGRDDTRPPPPESSCPFVYSFNGTEYVLDSETFAGAVARGLERTDVDNLEHAVAVEGRYRFLLTNERPETQYTDELALLVIDHRDGTTLLPDREGGLHAVASLRPALAAEADHGGDAAAALARRDGVLWTGASVETIDPSVDGQLRDGVVLTFRRPAGDHPLLTVTARNTVLAPYALRTYLELQGDSLGAWYSRVARDPELRGRLTGWFAREGTLHVAVLVDGRWVRQDALPDVGPYVDKTVVARLDLAGVTGDTVRVRLEWARGLWTLDHIALGHAATGGIAATHRVALQVEPGSRHGNVTAGEDADAITRRLAEADDDYYVALMGDTLRLSAPAPPEPGPGLTRSVTLRSRGYYLLHTRHAGAPQHDVAERILREPLFGNRFILERWRREGRTPAEAGTPD